ncbi:hypothetical protein DFH09DRAFT_1075753 [Mycena vulgaris]|nr:hypothetical protein DFH09DRAFT_1075753 [Mycena vulgaris]
MGADMNTISSRLQHRKYIENMTILRTSCTAKLHAASNTVLAIRVKSEMEPDKQRGNEMQGEARPATSNTYIRHSAMFLDRVRPFSAIFSSSGLDPVEILQFVSPEGRKKKLGTHVMNPQSRGAYAYAYGHMPLTVRWCYTVTFQIVNASPECAVRALYALCLANLLENRPATRNQPGTALSQQDTPSLGSLGLIRSNLASISHTIRQLAGKSIHLGTRHETGLLLCPNPGSNPAGNDVPGRVPNETLELLLVLSRDLTAQQVLVTEAHALHSQSPNGGSYSLLPYANHPPQTLKHKYFTLLTAPHVDHTAPNRV